MDTLNERMAVLKIGDDVICERNWIVDKSSPKRFVTGVIIRVDEKEVLIQHNNIKLKFRKEYTKISNQ